MNVSDVTVIVLTKNEEKNIENCLISAKQIATRLVVVDCGSTDETVQKAQSCGAEVFFHPWSGHAAQFNWALDNCGIDTCWVFRLDADEQISEGLAEEINRELSGSEANTIDGYQMRWRIHFMNKQLRYGGTHKPYFLRLFRYGKGCVENKLMDEHILVEGAVKKLEGDLIHYDYKGLDAWLTKHIWYSNLELKMYDDQDLGVGGNAAQRKKRSLYYRLPAFFRARLYFWFRYYFQLGFLDGVEGKVFCFLQAYWYRFLVDAKIYELERGGEQYEKNSDSDGEISPGA